MTLSDNIKFGRYALASLLAVVLGAGCAKQEPITDDTPLPLSVQAKLPGGGEVGTTPVSVTRLVIVDQSTSLVVLNQSTDTGLQEITPGSQTYALSLPAGQYRLYLVANETEAMTTALSRATRLSDLEAVTVNGPFDDQTVPYFGTQDFMFRKPQSGIGGASPLISTDGGTNWTNRLEVDLKRTQCKVSLYLRKRTGFATEVKITKVELRNIPDHSYLISRVYDAAVPVSKVLFSNPAGISLGADAPDGNDDPASYTMIFAPGALFPEKITADKSDPAKAACLKIEATCGAMNLSYTIPLRDDLAVENYDLRRNAHYEIYGTIKEASEIEAQVRLADWKDGGTIDVEQGMYYLNISAVSIDYPNTLYVDHNRDIWVKDAAGNYAPPADFDCEGIFWTNRPASTVSLTPLHLDDDPDAPTSITNSLTILRDNQVGPNSYDVEGVIRVHVPAAELKAGLTKSYSLRIRTDKLDRKLSFRVPKYDFVPYIVDPGFRTLTDLVNNTTPPTTETFPIEVYLPQNCELSTVLTPASSYVYFSFEKGAAGSGDIYEPQKYTVKYTSKKNWVNAGAFTVKLIIRKKSEGGGVVGDTVYELPFDLSFNIKKN